MVADERDGPGASRRHLLLGGATALAAAAPFVPGAVFAQAAEQTAPGILQGKIALVTGCARGIGRAIAVALAAQGADVAGLDIAGPVSPVPPYPPATPEDLAETGEQVQAQGRRWIPITADIRDLPALREAVAHVLKEFGRIDILVADAGIQTFQNFLDMDDQHWHDIIDVNLNGTANTMRAVAPHMAERKSGRMILIASSQGRRGFHDGASYSASKWGMIGLMKSAALDLGAHKITVNCIIPGLVDTPMTRNQARWTEALKTESKNPPQPPPEQAVEHVGEMQTALSVPWLKPEDIAPAAVFLASDYAAMVTGATYDVTAGASAHYTA